MLQAWTPSAPSLKAWCLREFLFNAAPTRPRHALPEPWYHRAFHPFLKGERQWTPARVLSMGQ